MIKDLKAFLDKKSEQYNNPSFIKEDPVSIPHSFTKKQDIEIAAFFAATFAWGNRISIINKSKELMCMMDNAPYQFVTQHKEIHLKKFLYFKHRTFNTTDLLHFIQFLKHHYQHYKSLEAAFFPPLHSVKREIKAAFFPPLHPVERGLGGEVEQALIHFHNYFFSLEHSPSRTKKHISTPQKKSACKRLNMFLRWMVRKDKNGVDFGIWKKISHAQLICPIDVHVARVAKRLNLLQRKQADWQAALELTEHLKKFDANDPVKYDYALFGLGIIEKFY